MKAACVQCRVRKVRCDGTLPRCRSCERLQFQCSLERDGSQPVGHYAPRLPPKCRGSRACLECRAMKVRCSGDLPQCSNCKRRSRACHYSSSAKGASSSPNPSGASASASQETPAVAALGGSDAEPEQDLDEEDQHMDSDGPAAETATSSAAKAASTHNSNGSSGSCPSQDVVLALVELYFARLYQLPSYNFLHRATIIQRSRDDTIDKALRLAICALSAQVFSQHADERDAWAQESERLIFDRLDRPSIFMIQASILLMRYRASVGQFPRAFIMAGLTARWAVALRLNYEHSRLGHVAQEVRRRTFWALFLLEDSFCIGIKEFELFDADTVHLRLPCEDADMDADGPVSTGYLLPTKGIEPEVFGLRAAWVRLTLIRRGAIGLNRRVSIKEASFSELFSVMERLTSDLLRLQSRLAPCDRYPPPNPDEINKNPLYTVFHMCFHYCQTDIYRMFLTGYPEATAHAAVEGMSPAERTLMKDKCIFHATQIVKVLSEHVQHKDERDILEHDVAVCAYHGARLVLFGTYTGSDNTGVPMQTAINKAQLCLDVITRSFNFTAQLKNMRQELERVIEQHQSWLESSDSRAVATVDLTAKPPAKLTSDAYIRQRLAIHSLLRQSDFVDDSRDAAFSDPAVEPSLAWTASTDEDAAATAGHETQRQWTARASGEPLPEHTADPNFLFGLPYSGGSLDFDNAWACNPAPQDLSGYLGVFDEQYMY